MPNRLERLIAIKDLIDRDRYPTVETMCEMFEIQPRTLHDDLRLMRDQMAMDIKYDRTREGYYNATKGKELPTFDLSAGEVFALTLAKDLLVEYTGTPFLPILQSALEKIRERLPEKVRVDVKDIAAAVNFGSTPTTRFSRKMFMELHESCERHIKVSIEYVSAYKGEQTKRAVQPYKLLSHQNSWYLVAYCELRQDLRLFALHRIAAYEILADEFVPIDKEKLDEWLNSPLFIEHKEQQTEIVIRFGARSARYIKEKTWHPSQTIKDEDDGGCTMTFTSTSLDEVKRWLLPYGGDAEVLAPQLLRESMISEFETAIARYRR